LSGIRATYSGLITLLTGFITIFTGLFVMVIVTRTLTPEEFGSWNLIGTLLVYGMVLDPIVSYWATREIARGKKTGKNAILSNGMLSIGGIAIFVVIAFVISSNSVVDYNILLLGVILVPNRYLLKVLSAINIGWKPQVIGYATITTEILRIPLALLFIVFMDLGIFGVILTYFITTLSNNIIQLSFAKEKIKEKFNIKFLKKWIKLSWLPVYPRISQLLYRTDLIIFPIITGSLLGVAQFSAALLVAGIVNYVGGFVGPAYSKLLETEKNEYIQNNLTVFLFFAIPIVALSITFAKEGLFILNPIYQSLDKVVIILAIQTFLYTLTSVLALYLTGMEKVDKEGTATFKEYIKSKLFYLPTIGLIHFIIYLVILSVLLVILDKSDENLILYWALILLFTEIPFSIYFGMMVRKNFNVKILKSKIFKYVLASIISFGSIYFIKDSIVDYNSELYIFVLSFLILIGMSLGTYALFTYKTDKDAHLLMSSIVKEIMIKIKK
jgi:hypothetical protein